MKNFLIKKLINNTVNQIFENINSSRTDELHVYDFDDTLVRTNSTIYVVNTKTNERLELHPDEFHEYNLKQYEKFDLSNFHGVKNPVILPHFKKLQLDYEKLGPRGVAILTARPRAEGIKKFLKKYGMKNVAVTAIGIDNPSADLRNANAERKKQWLKMQLDNRPIGFMSFYDDNEANIQAAKSLESEYPDVVFNIKQV